MILEARELLIGEQLIAQSVERRQLDEREHAAIYLNRVYGGNRRAHEERSGERICAPDTEITAPVTITGSASDNAILAYYQLKLRPAGTSSNDWVEIARGDHAVVSGNLGTLNPTTLANGIYELGLFATDANGLISSQTLTLEITRDLKLGQFSLSFEKLKS